MVLPIDYNGATPAVRIMARNQYVNEQEGKCYYCKAKLNQEPASEVANKPVDKGLFPPNFFKWPVHLHHNHETGLTIGAVHCYCNAVLWEYEGE